MHIIPTYKVINLKYIVILLLFFADRIYCNNNLKTKQNMQIKGIFSHKYQLQKVHFLFTLLFRKIIVKKTRSHN